MSSPITSAPITTFGSGGTDAFNEEQPAGGSLLVGGSPRAATLLPSPRNGSSGNVGTMAEIIDPSSGDVSRSEVGHGMLVRPVNTISDRAKEYKKTCIAVGIFFAVTAAVLAMYFGWSGAHDWIKGAVNKITDVIGEGPAIIVASVIAAIVLRYLYRGANYLFRGVYIKEVDAHYGQTDYSNLELCPKEENPLQPACREIHDRSTMSGRAKEKWKSLALIAAVAIGLVVFMVFRFDPSANASTFATNWNNHVWSNLDKWVFTPIHDRLGDAGGIMLASAAGLLVLNSLYQLGKFIYKGKYDANMRIHATNDAYIEGPTWFSLPGPSWS